MNIRVTPSPRLSLDARLAALPSREDFRAPPRGWLRAIREALGMSGVQFAARLGVRQQTADAMEKSEAAGTIQLGTLRRAAQALDCTLVYALVPNTSLEETVHRRAREIALRDIRRVDHTMKLEAQETPDADLEQRIDAYIRDVLRERDLWREV